ncbi:MAG: hypothetical protein SF069_06220 [Phycisphaerae bacterium]|nr:hypothetical protein [Phycisphaerae bacterium]
MLSRSRVSLCVVRIAPIPLAAAITLLAACDPPRETHATAGLVAQSQPAASAPTSQPTSAPASQPASAPTTTSAPTTASAPTPDPPPSYLKVIQTDRAGSAGIVKAKIGPGSKLTLDTDNVRRLRIDRAELELPANRSIVLNLDGQVIEWRANSPVREFERTPAGVWQPVRPARPN